MVDSQYYLPNSICISKLDCKEAFELLSSKEKLYAHYLSRAAWYGGLVVLLQTSPESPEIYVLLQKLFRKQTPAELEKVASEAGLTSEEYKVSITVIMNSHSTFPLKTMHQSTVHLIEISVTVMVLIS